SGGRVPARLGGLSAGQHQVDIGGSGAESLADEAAVLRSADLVSITAFGGDNRRRCGPLTIFECRQLVEQRLPHQRGGQIDARTVAAVRVDVGRKRNGGIAPRLERGEFGG